MLQKIGITKHSPGFVEDDVAYSKKMKIVIFLFIYSKQENLVPLFLPHVLFLKPGLTPLWTLECFVVQFHTVSSSLSGSDVVTLGQAVNYGQSAKVWWIDDILPSA